MRSRVASLAAFSRLLARIGITGWHLYCKGDRFFWYLTQTIEKLHREPIRSISRHGQLCLPNWSRVKRIDNQPRNSEIFVHINWAKSIRFRISWRQSGIQSPWTNDLNTISAGLQLVNCGNKNKTIIFLFFKCGWVSRWVISMAVECRPLRENSNPASLELTYHSHIILRNSPTINICALRPFLIHQRVVLVELKSQVLHYLFSST